MIRFSQMMSEPQVKNTWKNRKLSMKCESTLALLTVCLHAISAVLLLTGLTGFAVVGEYEDAKIKEAQSEAFEQMLQWLKSH